MHTIFVRSINTILNMPKGTWFYAVKKGRVPGVYHSWPECQSQVTGFSNPIFKKFETQESAQEFVYGSSGASSAGTHKSFEEKTKVILPFVKSVEDVMQNTTDSSVEEELKMIKSTLLTTQNTLATVVSQVAQLVSTVNRIESVVFHAPSSRRQFHTSNSKVVQKKQGSQEDDAGYSENSSVPKKKMKFDFDAEDGDFSGEPFPENLGTHVYTDGGCFDNGREGATAGIGVYWSDNHPDNVSERLSGRQTNNRAEIHAAVRAIQLAKERGINNLVLHTDSQFLINGITKWIKKWMKNGWKLSTKEPVINREDFEKLHSELKGINVKWIYVKGHSGDPGNEAVDALAKEASRNRSK